MNKTLLALAVSTILTAACGSGSDDPAAPDDVDAAPVTTPTPNPMAPLEDGQVPGDGTADGAPDDGAPIGSMPPDTAAPTPGDDATAPPVADGGSGTDTPVDIDTPVGTTDPAPDAAANDATLDADNYVDVLSAVFDTFTGNTYASRVFPIYKAYPLELAPERYVELVETQGTVPLTCENGGTGTYATARWTFDGCQTGSRVLDGTFSADPGGPSGALFVFDSPGITSESQDGYVSFAGTLDYIPNGARGSALLEWDARIERLELIDGDEVFALADLETSYNYGYLTNGEVSTYLDGSFTLRAPVVGGREIRVEVTDALRRVFDPATLDGNNVAGDLDTDFFQTGTLRLTAADGNTLVLDADTGDDATARVTITANGTSEEYVADWSLWLEALRFARDGRLVDVGDF